MKTSLPVDADGDCREWRVPCKHRDPIDGECLLYYCPQRGKCPALKQGGNPMDIDARLRELAQLQDGWLDGKGRALDSAALEKLARLFGENFSSDLPEPHLYPTPEGNVQAEWTLGAWEVSLEIVLGDFSAEFHAVHTNTGEERSRNLLLGSTTGWRTLNTDLGALK